MFKYIYQSCFGCEHLISDEVSLLSCIKEEYKKLSEFEEAKIDDLDGKYSRLFLSYLNKGLSPETLAKIFLLSSKNEKECNLYLLEKIQVLSELVALKEIPFDKKTYEIKLENWKKQGFPAIHHSDSFRKAYQPAYRVIDNRFLDFIRLFCEIDNKLKSQSVIVAIEGGSASGKSTLALILQDVYDCNVFHMDDFFLLPRQRTVERLAEIGGNVDKERFFDEIIVPVTNKRTVNYRPFDCQTMQLGDVITVKPNKLTVIEGVYSMHPYFAEYYDISVFLRISSDYQKIRIEKRNAPILAKRYFEEWIPLENNYFKKTDLQNRCGIIIDVNEYKF